MLKLFDNYYYDIVSPEKSKDFLIQRKIIRKDAYKDFYVYNIKDLLSKKEHAASNVLQKNISSRETLMILVYFKKEIIGYHFWVQKDENEFYMWSSAIAKQHRWKWIYTMLLDIIVSILTKRWYQKIISCHHVWNNSVLIPKLYKWFYIAWMSIDPMRWTLVDLVYFTNKKVRKAFEIRSWWCKPTKAEANKLGI